MKKSLKSICLTGAFILNLCFTWALVLVVLFGPDIPFISNVIKSNIVVCMILLLLCSNILMFLMCFLSKEKKVLKIIALILIFVSLTLIVCVKDYTYPFEREKKVELVAEIGLAEGRKMTEAWVDHWEVFFNIHGLKSYSIIAGFEGHELDFELPEMNLEKYTYIITYGKKIKKLTYSIWDYVDLPFRGGVTKAGYMQFYEDFDCTKVYVYRLKRMCIDNPNGW